MPITLDGTLGVGTPGITLAGGAITANANQLNSSAEDINSENRIINGDFGVWQRATSSSVTGVYAAADRWVNNGTGGTVTQAKIDLAVGSTLGSNGVKSILRQTVSGQSLPSHFASTVQRIEGVHSYAGQTITVLGWIGRSSGAGNVTLASAQTFGTGGSPSATVEVSATTITLSGTMQPFAVVINVPSITGKTLGTSGTDQFILRFYTSAGSDLSALTNNLGIQTIGVDFWGIHIRVGTWTAADTALYRPRDPGTELFLCERYCQYVTVSAQSPVPGSVSVPWTNRTRMRAAPALTVVQASIATVNCSVAGDTVEGTLGGYFGILATANAGYVVGRRYILDAEI